MMYGIPVLVKSRIQRMNAKSSTNAEIIALCDTVEEVVWLKHLLTELGEIIDQPTIQVDNDPAIDTVHHKICKGNKHIANRYYFVRDYWKEKLIKIDACGIGTFLFVGTFLLHACGTRWTLL